MPKAKRSNRPHNKSHESKKHGKKGKKPRNKSLKLDIQSISAMIADTPISRNISITVNSIARARKAQLEAMKGNSSEDDSEDNYHDHNVCIAGRFGIGMDSPIPDCYMKYFDIVEEAHSPCSLGGYRSCSTPDISSYVSPTFSINSSPETTPVREPFPSPLDRDLEDHVSNEASHAPSSPLDRDLEDHVSNDASHAPSSPFD
ncbi:uncharacterized protein LOC131617444 [Vicia villosa]|uniref:uncharacterized protein LOC131617444 n=1 Tax=Vicia villosa TaxID=3911 RepID=UPI00273C0E64|nr:uncharacterized protein LOC131617444 [Vicia villosa]XP_058744714.1 uncharacterized protein LOC131617444 [Vicia villosa]